MFIFVKIWERTVSGKPYLDLNNLKLKTVVPL